MCLPSTSRMCSFCAFSKVKAGARIGCHSRMRPILAYPNLRCICAGPKTPRNKGVEVSIAAASQTNGSPEERTKVLVAPLEGEVKTL